MSERRTWEFSEDAPAVGPVTEFFRRLLCAYRTDGGTQTRPVALVGDEVEKSMAEADAQLVRVGSAQCAVVQGTKGLRNEVLGTRGWELRLETVGLAVRGATVHAAYFDRDEAYASGTVYRKETTLTLAGDAPFLEQAAQLWLEATGCALPGA